MNRYDRISTNPRLGADGTDSAMEAVIRPCLLQAFQLPPEDHRDDDRFQYLLEALARRGGGRG